MQKLAALGLLLGLTCAGSSAGASKAGSPFLLVRLPSLGTVTWRCDLHRRNHFALAYHPSPPMATTTLRLRVKGRVVRAMTLNSTRTVQLPSLGAQVQELDLAQMTEPGTLRAVVRVDFAAGRQFHCEPYLPPGLAVQLLPR